MKLILIYGLPGKGVDLVQEVLFMAEGKIP